MLKYRSQRFLQYLKSPRLSNIIVEIECLTVNFHENSPCLNSLPLNLLRNDQPPPYSSSNSSKILFAPFFDLHRFSCSLDLFFKVNFIFHPFLLTQLFSFLLLVIHFLQFFLFYFYFLIRVEFW